mgnify:CR=1 FL=1|jgi:hypothetical protein
MSSHAQQTDSVPASSPKVELSNPRHEVTEIDDPRVEIEVSIDVRNMSSETLDSGVHGTAELEEVGDSLNSWSIGEVFYPGTEYTLHTTWQLDVQTDEDWALTQSTEIVSPADGDSLRYTMTAPGVGDDDGSGVFLLLLAGGGAAAAYLFARGGGDDS